MGKIIVASYMGWRKMITADYSKFNLIVADDYKTMKKDDFVYNHDGDLLYWFTMNPEEIPIYDYSPFMNQDDIGEERFFLGESFRYNYAMSYADCHSTHFLVDGLDCDGVPTFSHCTQDRVAESYKDVEKFEPLTVATVIKWFWWLAYQLNNSSLQIGK